MKIIIKIEFKNNHILYIINTYFRIYLLSKKIHFLSKYDIFKYKFII